LIIDDGMVGPRHALDLGSFAMLAYMVAIWGTIEAHLGSTSDASITSFIAVAKQSIGVAVLVDDMLFIKLILSFEWQLWLVQSVYSFCVFQRCWR
jgi:hypothetical protein